MSEFSIATQLVHSGERRAAPLGVPAATPIYATSTFVYERMEDVDRVVDGEESGFVYSRYGNPTVAALEEALAAIENGRPAAVSHNRQSSRETVACSSVWFARSAGAFSGTGPLSNCGAQTGNTRSGISQRARTPGQWPRP